VTDGADQGGFRRSIDGVRLVVRPAEVRALGGGQSYPLFNPPGKPSLANARVLATLWLSFFPSCPPVFGGIQCAGERRSAVFWFCLWRLPSSLANEIYAPN
jgi:hypothetical protein